MRFNLWFVLGIFAVTALPVAMFSTGHKTINEWSAIIGIFMYLLMSFAFGYLAGKDKPKP